MSYLALSSTHATVPLKTDPVFTAIWWWWISSRSVWRSPPLNDCYHTHTCTHTKIHKHTHTAWTVICGYHESAGRWLQKDQQNYDCLPFTNFPSTFPSFFTSTSAKPTATALRPTNARLSLLFLPLPHACILSATCYFWMLKWHEKLPVTSSPIHSTSAY